MKKFSFFKLGLFITIITTVILLPSCKKEHQYQKDNKISSLSGMKQHESNSEDWTRLKFVHVSMHIENSDRMPPVGNSTLLWNNRGHVPIMAPDHHQVTLGEFNAVSAFGAAKCDDGTQVKIHAKGLIPNGVYTIWVVVFKSPGFHGDLSNLIGMGPLGRNDGSENVFRASSSGTASLRVTMPSGPLSLVGSVGDCLFSEFEVHFDFAYHLDGMTHGGAPGPKSSWVAQSAFEMMANGMNNDEGEENVQE